MRRSPATEVHEITERPMTVTCPDCGTAGEGNFCAACGAPLKARACPSCGAEVPAGDRFCTRCGASATGTGAGQARRAPPPARGRVPWLVAAAAALAFFTLLFARGCEAPEPDPAAGDPRAIDLSAMTPEDAADRLFDRVMRSLAAGDTGQAREFTPMALAAYERLREPDDDQLYHMSVLQLFQGNASAAEAHADTILERTPDHLLALLASAQARRALRDDEGAAARYRRFLEVYPEEIAVDREEYRAHAPVLAEGREEARAFLR
jgi:tetratricopeptide (TPR) repeat protein